MQFGNPKLPAVIIPELIINKITDTNHEKEYILERNTCAFHASVAPDFMPKR